MRPNQPAFALEERGSSYGTSWPGNVLFTPEALGAKTSADAL